MIRMGAARGQNGCSGLVAPLPDSGRMFGRSLHKKKSGPPWPSWLLASIPLGGGIPKVTTPSIKSVYSINDLLHVKL
jgi:hypothetical protein